MATFIFLMIVVIVICVLLVMVILSQNPKGGGLSSTFGGGGSQMFGVQRTNNFLDKATWSLAIIIAVLVIVSNFVVTRQTSQTAPEDLIDQEMEAPKAPVNNEGVAHPLGTDTAPAKALPSE